MSFLTKVSFFFRYKKRHFKTHIPNPFEETQEEAAMARPPGDIDKELFDAAVRRTDRLGK